MKLAAIDRLGGEIIKVPYSEWWNIMITHEFPPFEGKLFLHPSSNPHVMAGNATIGLEILEDLPDVHTILIPWGSGGLSCGIASAVKAIKPDTKIFACEVETGAPVAASFKADSPQEVTYQPSFVDGIGSRSVLAEMWPLARKVLDGALVTSLAEIASAIKLLVERNRMVAEGAGAAPVALAISGIAGNGKVACVISGGNLNTDVLTKILSGMVPKKMRMGQ
jgi:threonine dehydratase